MTTSNKNINQEGQTVKPFNGTRGIFIPYSLLDSLHGDYYAAAIISQLFYWSQIPENTWKLQTMKELAKQLRMKYRTFFGYIRRLEQADLVVIEKRGSNKIAKLNQEKLGKLQDVDEIAQTVAEIATNSCKNGNSTVAEIATNSCKNGNSDSPQSLEPQQIAEPLDYNKINNKINKINNNILSSDDINFSNLEKSTKLEGVIEELKSAFKPDESIPPKEFEEPLLMEMLRAGFPRKSLRSKLDRENLLILKNHYGSWDAVIQALQKLQKLRESGQFLEWDWDRILRKADYILNYEPEPEFPVEKIPDLELLYRYFEKRRPPAKYVSRFVFRWKAFWRFQDLDYERTRRIIEKILKTYYNTVGAENGIEK